MFFGHTPKLQTLVGLVNQGILAGRSDTANHPGMVARRVQSQAAFQAESDAAFLCQRRGPAGRDERSMPEATAVVEPLGYDRLGKRQYRKVTFRELDEDSSRIAQGLCRMGVPPGCAAGPAVRPGIDFIALVFALLRAGAVVILIDPGMGRKNLLRCLADAEPEGFVAIPIVASRAALLRRRFPKSRFHVTVGRRWFWGGTTLAELAPVASNPPRPWSPWLSNPQSPIPFPTPRGSPRHCMPTTRPRSSSPPAAPARPRACSIPMAILTPRSRRSATSTESSRVKSISPVFPSSGCLIARWG